MKTRNKAVVFLGVSSLAITNVWGDSRFVAASKTTWVSLFAIGMVLTIIIGMIIVSLHRTEANAKNCFRKEIDSMRKNPAYQPRRLPAWVEIRYPGAARILKSIGQTKPHEREKKIAILLEDLEIH